MKSAADATTGNTWGVVDYTYDNTDQLQTATYATFAAAPADEDYGYDANGNRNTNGNTVEATGDNRQAMDSSGNAYTYDCEGNRLTRTNSTGAVMEYEWDYRNRLTKVTFKDNSAQHNATKTVEYTYDFLSRLVKETVTAGAAVTRTVFVHDGIESVLQFEKTGNGTLSSGQIHATPQSRETLPNTVCDGAVNIMWQVSLDGGKSWSNAGASQNWAYLTWNARLACSPKT